ncbi:hypothetical protein ACM66B_001746 [Microbotryomycetes sp. NB124-2]
MATNKAAQPNIFVKPNKKRPATSSNGLLAPSSSGSAPVDDRSQGSNATIDMNLQMQPPVKRPRQWTDSGPTQDMIVVQSTATSSSRAFNGDVPRIELREPTPESRASIEQHLSATTSHLADAIMKLFEERNLPVAHWTEDELKDHPDKEQIEAYMKTQNSSLGQLHKEVEDAKQAAHDALQRLIMEELARHVADLAKGAPNSWSKCLALETAVTSLRANINPLKEGQKQAEANMKRTATSVRELESKAEAVAKLSALVDVLADKVVSVQTLAERGAAVHDLAMQNSAEVKRLASEMNRAMVSVTNIKEDGRVESQKVESALQKVEHGLSNEEQRVLKLQTQTAAVDARLTTLDETTSAQARQILDMDTAHANQVKDLENNLKKHVDSLRSEVLPRTDDKHLTEAMARITGVAHVDTLGRQLRLLQSERAAEQSEIGRLTGLFEARVSQLEVRLEAAEARTCRHDVSPEFVALSIKVDDLCKRVEDVSVMAAVLGDVGVSALDNEEKLQELVKTSHLLDKAPEIVEQLQTLFKQGQELTREQDARTATVSKQTDELKDRVDVVAKTLEEVEKRVVASSDAASASVIDELKIQIQAEVAKRNAPLQKSIDDLQTTVNTISAALRKRSVSSSPNPAKIVPSSPKSEHARAFEDAQQGRPDLLQRFDPPLAPQSPSKRHKQNPSTQSHSSSQQRKGSTGSNNSVNRARSLTLRITRSSPPRQSDDGAASDMSISPPSSLPADPSRKLQNRISDPLQRPSGRTMHASSDADVTAP